MKNLLLAFSARGDNYIHNGYFSKFLDLSYSCNEWYLIILPSKIIENIIINHLQLFFHLLYQSLVQSSQPH